MNAKTEIFRLPRLGIRIPAGAVLLSLVLLQGCLIGRGKPPPPEQEYALEYPSPTYPDLAPLHEPLKVDRFYTVQAFNTTAMIFRSGPYKRELYNYNRWTANPADLVYACYTRDLMKSGLFRAVLTYRDAEKSRYRISGLVEDFLEVDEGGSARARLVLNATLFDDDARDPAGRILFQKAFSVEGDAREQTADGFAASMSRAMEKLSELMTGAVFDALSAETRGH
jgi:ABC-type uncharacterized transport system auxiliary subunit